MLPPSQHRAAAALLARAPTTTRIHAASPLPAATTTRNVSRAAPPPPWSTSRRTGTLPRRAEAQPSARFSSSLSVGASTSSSFRSAPHIRRSGLSPAFHLRRSPPRRSATTTSATPSSSSSSSPSSSSPTPRLKDGHTSPAGDDAPSTSSSQWLPNRGRVKRLNERLFQSSPSPPHLTHRNASVDDWLASAPPSPPPPPTPSAATPHASSARPPLAKHHRSAAAALGVTPRHIGLSIGEAALLTPPAGVLYSSSPASHSPRAAGVRASSGGESNGGTARGAAGQSVGSDGQPGGGASGGGGGGGGHRPYRTLPSRYPPSRQPKPVIFDQPAVPNPQETAEAHARFRRLAQRFGLALAALAVVGSGAYLALGGSATLHAEELRSDAAAAGQGDVAAALAGQASAALGAGSYALLAVKRSTIIAKAAALCVLDYKRTLNAKYATRADEAEELRQCHLRCAHRVLEALQQNGGLYIKLGQHLSSVILLPVEWTSTMRPLQDQNTPTPLADMERMFRGEMGGKGFEDYFDHVDERPIGVASLAQVHRVRSRETGEWLALKLMHPEVERFSHVDMQTVNVLVRWVKRVFPEFEFTWLAEEMNENMPLEMNFRHEAQNARRAEADFAHYRHTSVYIPKVRFATKRVLGMEFIDGRRPDDLAYLAEHAIDRNRVSQELSRTFAQMLYLHGFFHADPHGGNVLIRPAPKGSRSRNNFEVVLLDHGLYFDLDRTLRTNYAHFWLSLLKRTTPSVSAERRRYAKLIANIDDDLYPVLESAITGRSGLEGSDPNNPHGVKGRKRASSLLDMQSGSGLSDDEQQHIRQTVMQKEGLFLSILDLLRRVPRRMLMVLKLNDLTRSLDANLHTTHGPARPFIITARYCALTVWDDDRRRLRERRRRRGLSWAWLREYVACWWEYLWFYRGLSLLEGLSDLDARRRKVFSFSKALATGRDARRAAAGLEEQEHATRKRDEDTRRAREAVRGESKVERKASAAEA